MLFQMSHTFLVCECVTKKKDQDLSFHNTLCIRTTRGMINRVCLFFSQLYAVKFIHSIILSRDFTLVQNVLFLFIIIIFCFVFALSLCSNLHEPLFLELWHWHYSEDKCMYITFQCISMTKGCPSQDISDMDTHNSSVLFIYMYNINGHRKPSNQSHIHVFFIPGGPEWRETQFFPHLHYFDGKMIQSLPRRMTPKLSDLFE